jgi:hypothetical protein
MVLFSSFIQRLFMPPSIELKGGDGVLVLMEKEIAKWSLWLPREIFVH